MRYAEAVFSPGNHARRLGGDWHGPIEAVLDGLAAGERAHGVTVRLCPDIVRDAGMDDADRTLEVALRYAGRGVVALNCAGSERTGIEPFARHFRAAEDAGLRSVPHAGEWAGPENVWATLEHFRPDRIGHGVRAIEDPALVAELARRGIPLEVCPVSNVATGAYPSLAAHPFPALRAAGVVVTLNSDDPAMFGGWLTDVYAAAREAWDLEDGELAGDRPHRGRCQLRRGLDAVRGLRRGIDGWLAAPVASPASPGGTLSDPTGRSPMDLASPPDLDPLERLATSIREREAVVAVVGLGYVGLPLLVGIRHAGYPAIGFDSDAGKIAELRAGRSYLPDITSSEVASLERITYADDPRALGGGRHRRPVPARRRSPTAPPTSRWWATRRRRSPRTCARACSSILESTTWPGTTEEYLRPILETGGLVVGRRLRARLLARADRSRARATTRSRTPRRS